VRRGPCGGLRFAVAAQRKRKSLQGIVETRQERHFPIPRHRFFWAPGRLTKTGGAPYIEPLGRAAAWRDGASAKPLTVHTVTEHPAMLSWPCSRRCVECVGFCCLRPLVAGVTGRRGCEVPGCLTGESEERETWTAESLRAASGRGNLARKWPGRDFGGRRFRSTPGR
jgi:hypothetical protein